MVDREVREIEEPVAHARVLPVDDPQSFAVVEEVRVQEIVVAGDGHVRGPLRLDRLCDRPCPSVRVRNATPALERRRAVGLDHAEGVERPGYRGPSVKRTQSRRNASQHVRLAHPLDRRDLAVDEAGHQPSLGLDERDDLRADADRRRRLRCRELDAPVDPQQAGVLPRDPEDEALAVDLDLQVVVRDPAAEHLEACPATWPHALDLGSESAHARIRSPFGSNSGSSATTPATHSPKISTSTSVPTSCSTGR